MSTLQWNIAASDLDTSIFDFITVRKLTYRERLMGALAALPVTTLADLARVPAAHVAVGMGVL